MPEPATESPESPGSRGPGEVATSGWCMDYPDLCAEHGDLTQPEDVEALPLGVQKMIASNYAGCAYSEPGCAGPISGERVWQPEDLRLVARANEMYAETEDLRRRSTIASWHRERARVRYEWADELEAGTRPAPSPGMLPDSDSGWCQTYGGWCLEYGDLQEPSDVDRLAPEAWGTIALNYGECAGDTSGCPGPISGREVWTADDLRVVARAEELVADLARQAGDEEQARYADMRAERLYDQADDVEAGRREPPSPAPSP